MANRFFSPSEQFSNAAGKPYALGSLSFSATGTNTPLATYSDQALTAANANPVILDAAGRAGAIFLQNAAYKVVLADASSNVIWTEDPVYTSDYSTAAAFLIFAGNPNGNVAGNSGTTTVSASTIWDTVDSLLYVCTTTGTAIAAVWQAINSAPTGSLPTGSIIAHAGTTAPASFLLCSGGTASQVTYAALYALLGTTYGPAAGGTFTLPDLRGRGAFGQDSGGSGRITVAGGNFDGTVLGGSGGGQNWVLTRAQMPANPPLAPSFTGTGMTGNGTITGTAYAQGGSNSGGVATAGGAAVMNAALLNPTIGPGSFVPTGTLGNMGSGGFHPVLPPVLIVNYIIKT